MPRLLPEVRAGYRDPKSLVAGRNRQGSNAVQVKVAVQTGPSGAAPAYSCAWASAVPLACPFAMSPTKCKVSPNPSAQGTTHAICFGMRSLGLSLRRRYEPQRLAWVADVLSTGRTRTMERPNKVTAPAITPAGRSMSNAEPAILPSAETSSVASNQPAAAPTSISADHNITTIPRAVQRLSVSPKRQARLGRPTHTGGCLMRQEQKCPRPIEMT